MGPMDSQLAHYEKKGEEKVHEHSGHSRHSNHETMDESKVQGSHVLANECANEY